MRRVVLLAVLALALPVAFADSVTDYATFGTTSAGTATWSGIPVTAGGTISVTSALFAINNVSQPAGGTISLTTGTLTAVTGGVSSPGGLNATPHSTSTAVFPGALSRGSLFGPDGVTSIQTGANKSSETMQIAHAAA